jgi:hypothetical protein
VTAHIDPLVGETDAMLRALHAGTVPDQDLREWVDQAMTTWTSPLASQGAQLLNEALMSGDSDQGAVSGDARAWWDRERTAYTADPAAWDRQYWLRYLQGLASQAGRGARRTARSLVQRGVISRGDAEDVLQAAGLEWWDGGGEI